MEDLARTTICPIRVIQWYTYLWTGADYAVGPLDRHIPDLHFAIPHLVFLVVKSQLHASHFRFGIPTHGLEVLWPHELAGHTSREFYL